MPEEFSAGAIVFRKNHSYRFLLLCFGHDHWEFPKGLIEQGETKNQAALRETKEETGLDITLIPGFEEVVHYPVQRKGKTITKEVTFFLAEAKEGDVTISWEHSGYEWLGFEESAERLHYPEGKEALVKAHDFLRKRKKV